MSIVAVFISESEGVIVATRIGDQVDLTFALCLYVTRPGLSKYIIIPIDKVPSVIQKVNSLQGGGNVCMVFD